MLSPYTLDELFVYLQLNEKFRLPKADRGAARPVSVL